MWPEFILRAIPSARGFSTVKVMRYCNKVGTGLQSTSLSLRNRSGRGRGRPMTAIKILDWRTLRKGSLLGFAKVEFRSGLIISDVTILTSEKGPWASPPSKPMIGRDGAIMKATVSGNEPT
jgi:hypothetical protein